MRFWPAIVGFALVSAPANGQPLQVYFGNLHSHTSYSDGSGTPREAYRHARHTAKIDFLAITEHNHRAAESGAQDRQDGLLIAKDPGLYEDLKREAAGATVEGEFVALYGQEFSSISQGNHVNVFEIGDVIPAKNGAFDELTTWLGSNLDSGQQPAIIQFNHPKLFRNESKAYGADDFPSRQAWLATMGKHAALLEVFNGPAMAREGGHRPAESAEYEYLHYLNLGFRLAPTADQDNHYFTWGDATDARTGVIAPSLTRPNLLAALRARHVYASEDKNLVVIARLNGALTGDIVAAPSVGTEISIAVEIRDPDEPDASYSIEVLSGVPGEGIASRVQTALQLGDTTSGTPLRIGEVVFQQPGQYVLLRLEQQGEHEKPDRVWLAPVWFEAGVVTPMASVPVLSIVSAMPNPAGRDDLNELVTLKNQSSQPVELRGWRLMDEAESEWRLDVDGTIPPGGTIGIRRNSRPMALNNGGDTIRLVDPLGNEVDRLQYQNSSEGVAVTK